VIDLDIESTELPFPAIPEVFRDFVPFVKYMPLYLLSYIHTKLALREIIK
jgi:hypothetical protein